MYTPTQESKPMRKIYENMRFLILLYGEPYKSYCSWFTSRVPCFPLLFHFLYTFIVLSTHRHFFILYFTRTEARISSFHSFYCCSWHMTSGHWRNSEFSVVHLSPCCCTPLSKQHSIENRARNRRKWVRGMWNGVAERRRKTDREKGQL